MKINPNAKIEYKSEAMSYIASDNRYLLYRIAPSELRWWQRIFCNKWRHVRDAMHEYSPFYGKYCELYDYEEAQRRIREAMQNGEKYVYLPGKNGSSNEFAWSATSNTIARLREDGFDIDEVWDPFEYWSIEWGY